tara:strand:+ start:1509 stop:1760 length:252 start_codon:yes stop_codon:yes gene_type:complete
MKVLTIVGLVCAILGLMMVIMENESPIISKQINCEWFVQGDQLYPYNCEEDITRDFPFPENLWFLFTIAGMMFCLGAMFEGDK